jgi:hypothetical protein
MQLVFQDKGLQCRYGGAVSWRLFFLLKGPQTAGAAESG